MLIEQIFLDLDECLVSTIYKPNGAPRNRTKILLFNNWLNKDEVYWSVLRPGALEFLAYCRNIAPTYILTAAATDYAQEHNRVHNLGFSDDQIYGRDFYCYYKSGMFHDSIINTKVDYAPNSILVDNQDIKKYGSENLRVKMRFLGIKEDRLVKSREYTGGKQPPSFDKEIKQIEDILRINALNELTKQAQELDMGY